MKKLLLLALIAISPIQAMGDGPSNLVKALLAGVTGATLYAAWEIYNYDPYAKQKEGARMGYELERELQPMFREIRALDRIIARIEAEDAQRQLPAPSR